MGMDKRATVSIARMMGASEGGSRVQVKNNFDSAEKSGESNGIPWIFSQMYAPTPIVNTDHSRNEGVGMVDTLYLPVQASAAASRGFADKLGKWFATGEFK